MQHRHTRALCPNIVTAASRVPKSALHSRQHGLMRSGWPAPRIAREEVKALVLQYVAVYINRNG
jgi:hypothetical protein